MNITGIGTLAGTQSQQNIQKGNNRLQIAIAALVSGRRTDDVAALSIATQLQSEVSSLKTASGNIAQASSLAQVADGGAGQIREALDKLKSLAQQANSPLVTEESRRALNQEFKGIVAEIDRLANSTSFNGQKLLDGSVSGNNSLSLTKLLGASESIDDGALSIDSLRSSDLFSGESLDILTPQAASRAVEVLGDALNKTTSVRATIGSFQQSLNFAAANIDSAVANQEAARSILQDSDFAADSTETSLANILRNAAIAIQAQGNRLSPNLLKLVS